MTGLSHQQKRDIAIAARRAYDAWPEREAFEAINSELSKTDCFNAWRHVETGKATSAGSGQAVGIQSLKDCTQAHWAPVLAHFQKLAGDAAGAQRTLVRDAGNGRRVARYKLGQALTERGLETGYAAAICRRQFRCALDDASEKQLWNIFYTVRNRRKVAVPAAATTDGNPF
jgi:hypothetical protein